MILKSKDGVQFKRNMTFVKRYQEELSVNEDTCCQKPVHQKKHPATLPSSAMPLQPVVPPPQAEMPTMMEEFQQGAECRSRYGRVIRTPNQQKNYITG